ncbi:hypothetical protein MMC22_008840 [Lobaria immixta]|nr:hypothetical protein [Lobaria immixta]
MNGMLLFAAKGLEVWYTFVAGLLVYEAQVVLRESNGGLPEGYKLSYLEFSDLLNLFHVSKWTRPIRDAYHAPERLRQMSKLGGFVLLACFMTLVVNLMGPATGVLILPSVQSIDQYGSASELFIQMGSHKPPAVGDGRGLVGCNATLLKDHLYSCAEYVRGSELDSMTSFVVAPSRNLERTRNDTSLIILAESQEDDVQFLAFNFTINIRGNKTEDYYNSFTVPSRQTLRMVSADVGRVINDSDLMNKSMQVSSKRNGPAIFVSGLNMNLGEIRSFSVGDHKSVTCMDRWTTNQKNDTRDYKEYTKCIRNGTGWNINNSQAGFSIGSLREPNADAEANSTVDILDVLVYFSDKATYYGPDLNHDSRDVACLTGSSSTKCNWDDIFSPAKFNGSPFNGIFSNTTIVEWSSPSDPQLKIWFEFVSYLKFGVYSVDLSVGNEMSFADLNSGGPGSEQLVIDPLWTLAAWSVDVGGTVNASRFPTLLPEGPDFISDIGATNETFFEFCSLNIFAIAQTMSLISYDSTILDKTTAYDKNKDNVLYNWVTRRVWAYGLGTRTSRLGVAVVCAGMVTVVFRVIFAVYNYRPKDDSVQLVASP